jgi:UPF0755 protein
MPRRLISSAIVICLGALVFLALSVQRYLQAPLDLPPEGLIINVKPGSSFAAVVQDLGARGVIQQPLALRVVGRLSGAHERIRHGEYRLSPGLALAGLLELLQSGDTVRYLVTLPEGIRLRDALDILARAEGVETTLVGADDPRLRELLGEVPSVEGYFLPETYQYQRGDTDIAILREAHRLSRATLHEAWRARQPDLPYAEPYDALIMASVIEKETGVARERARIAGVFVRRLQRNMRLQTDPTVIYGLGSDFDGNLTRSHLRDEGNTYNTYRHRGLPPGPIALPGREAIHAALHPTPGTALYFVARGDGTHAFSSTLEDHQRAVREYQLQRRANYRSTPPETP